MRVINREGFYYLQHTYRKGKKVVCKEIYLGKTIPPNIEQIKSNLLKEIHKPLFNKFDIIKKNYQKQWRKYPKSMKDKFKQQLAIDFTYNTNAIEGSTITYDETRELVEHRISPHKPLRDVKETEDHVKVFLKMLDRKDMLSLKLILKWHKELFKETKPDICGKFRDFHVRVGDYICPDWQDVKKLMKNFIKFYRKNKNMHLVELASRMHYKFEMIHPFGDGNGRVGRLIMNYILWHNKFPILIIEYKKRSSYYRALQRDENKFFNYFARRYLSKYNGFLKSK
mgnify:CR=1 FL=1|tara:strand:+ start:14122 stop:14970 length:849 start_codon:yes stop_codon:yes gene_type:complete